MKNSSEDDDQHTKYEHTCEVSQKYYETFFLLELIQLICEYITDVGPFITIAEDLGMSIVTVTPDEEILGFLDEEGEHAEADCKQSCLCHG